MVPRLIIVAPLGAVLLAAPTAGAQPVPPTVPVPQPPPAAAPPPAHPLLPLAQSGSPVGIAGIPPGLLGPSGAELTLGQHAAPAVPGTAPTASPNLNPFNNQYLLPQNVEPAAPGEGTLFGIEPGQEHADIGAGDYLRRLWEMYQAGGLQGGLLGQRPVETLNGPLEIDAPAQPAAGSQSPEDTIRELTGQGFDVRINWVAGTPSNIPLSQCTVTSVDTSAPPAAYVSINCPPDGSQ